MQVSLTHAIDFARPPRPHATTMFQVDVRIMEPTPEFPIARKTGPSARDSLLGLSP